MKKVSQELDDQLLLYLDGQLDSAARERFELALKQNDALRQRLVQLQEMESSMKKNTVEEPSKNFTQLVMQKLDQNPAASGSFTMFNGILLLIGILLLTGIATVLVSSGVFDQATGTIDLNTITSKAIVNVTAIDFH
jgi:anti-sigma factor RsiW